MNRFIVFILFILILIKLVYNYETYKDNNFYSIHNLIPVVSKNRIRYCRRGLRGPPGKNASLND